MRVAICCKGVPVEAVLESVHVQEGDLLYKDTDFLRKTRYLTAGGCQSFARGVH